MILREARAADIVKFTKYHLPVRYIGIVCEEEGEVIGLGAIIIGENQRPWVVLDMLPEMRDKKVTLHRVGRDIVNAGVRAFGKVYVMQDQREPTSKRWLEHLGFRDTGEVYRGENIMEAGD